MWLWLTFKVVFELKIPVPKKTDPLRTESLYRQRWGAEFGILRGRHTQSRCAIEQSHILTIKIVTHVHHHTKQLRGFPNNHRNTVIIKKPFQF